MKINILCLYHDIMNLYGETGNIKVLEYHLKEQKIKYEITKKTLEDDLDFQNYDLIMIGAGTEQNRMLCLNHLKKYQKEIKQAIKNNKFFLVTGNALGMFGKTLYNEPALNIFNFEVKQKKERTSEEVIYENKISRAIYGFINHEDELINITEKGIIENNFYGTYVLGPILSRNPELLEYFLKKLITSKDKDFKFKKINTKLNKQAYQEFIEFKKTKKFNSNHA